MSSQPSRSWVLIIVLVFASASGAAALERRRVSDFAERLSSSDWKVRSKAAGELFNARPELAGKEVLPLLCKAIEDVDPRVRFYGSAGLFRVARATLPKQRGPKAGQTGLLEYGPANATLLRAIQDENEQTRTNALGAYLFTYPVEAELQNELVARFPRESSLGAFQPMIIAAITIDGSPTSSAKALLMRVLVEPTHVWMVAKALAESIGTPEPEFLPELVAQLSALGPQAANGYIAKAVERYGVMAKPYLPQLVEAIGAQSSHEGQKAIEGVIESVNAAK